ncbi:Regulatory protein alcR [Trichoderma ghanense]|uniref:Regulatory protein alcR n=1 Tax=Trichoderma ghanense TaxID=65468 RepID=A0ABY2GPE8_9HYPO
MRRQNHSCDQCRRSKRGCDAPSLRAGQRNSNLGQLDFGNGSTKCSYCNKTNKTCTWEWAKAQTLQRSIAYGSKSPLKEIAGRRREKRDYSFDSPLAQEPLAGNNDDSYFSSLQADGWRVDDSLYFPGKSDYEWSIPTLQTSLFTDPFVDYSIPNDVPSFRTEVSEDPTTTSDPAGDATAIDSYKREPQLSEYLPGTDPISPAQYCYPVQEDGLMSLAKRRRISSDGTGSQRTSLSSFSAEQEMMSHSNSQLISTNLLQIYHDVLEHNLSCWLTEINNPLTAQPRNGDTENNMGLVREWGTAWSNRIYTRAIQLDRDSISANMVRLTPAQDASVTNALHLAIMAFATQWAQGSHRQRERYPTSFASPVDVSDGLAEEFDRSLQHQIWAQAKRALQDVDELESYRVALAELIFGLTQKAWDHEPEDRDFGGDIAPHSRGVGLETEVKARLGDIISKEGPPIYMERAARKVQMLQARYNAGRRGLKSSVVNNDAVEATGTSQFFSSKGNRETAGLLYWFAVMFDTVSSSMNERPVVVPDEDIPHYADEGLDDTAAEDDTPLHGRWDVGSFVHDDVENPAYKPTWPCPYEEAAKAVTKAAPVKVLLFRHLSYLQGILRKGARGKRVEDIISSTLSLYRYWNKTYGSFFRELMLDIDSVPERIRSWFFCISCHWNLAALMIADLVAFVDDNSLGTDFETRARIEGKIAWRIRDASTQELSELAVISIPYQGLQDESNFHHAVNEGTILTEPWTMILIRAFSMASAILLGEADEALRHGAAQLGYTGGHFEETLGKVMNCIKALWHLGKKSDMARKAADFLSLTTERLQADYGTGGGIG